MRGEFYQQLTNDLKTARAEGLFNYVCAASRYHCG